MKILKFRFRDTVGQTFDMPKFANIIKCGDQCGHVTMWAMCNSAEMEQRRFRIFATGAEASGLYIGTVLINGGSHVWHIFEQPI